MTILELPPGSSQAALVAAEAVLILHIAGGTVGLASGAAALMFRKGERMHRTAGNVFFVAMLIMSGIGACVSPFLTDGQRPNTVAGIMTFYLVATAWATVRRKDSSVGRFDLAALFVPSGVALAGVMFALEARNSSTGTIDGSPPQAFYVFMVIGTIAAASDLKVILRGGISGAPRIARHLWRMCTALFIAAGSLFLGQPQVFPEFVRGSPILFVPVLAPLALMIFWLIRVRLTNWFKREAVA
jgi:uncharacterized membrane protein